MHLLAFIINNIFLVHENLFFILNLDFALFYHSINTFFYRVSISDQLNNASCEETSVKISVLKIINSKIS